MDFVMGLVDRVVVMEFGTEDRRGHARARCSATRACSRPIWAASTRPTRWHRHDDAPARSARPVTSAYGTGRGAAEAEPATSTPASIVTVIGPNGAGKTTLLTAIMGVLPPTARRAASFDSPATIAPRRRSRSASTRGMTLVPEKRELFGEMTVEDNLLLGAFQRYRSGQRDHGADDASEVFTLFPRLKERRTQLAGTLSGGERQMLAIGRALMARPTLLMLDEPQPGPGAADRARDLPHHRRAARGAACRSCWSSRTRAPRCRSPTTATCWRRARSRSTARPIELAHDPRVIETYLGLGQKH